MFTGGVISVCGGVICVHGGVISVRRAVVSVSGVIHGLKHLQPTNQIAELS